MKKTLISLSLGFAVLAGATSAILLTTDDKRPDTANAEPQVQSAPTAAAMDFSMGGTTVKPEALPDMPPELAGLEPEVKLLTDKDGNLVPSHDLRLLLDFYLANVDQEPLDLVLQRIRSALGEKLQEPALGQALALLERYVSYGMSMEQMQETLPAGVTKDGFDLEALKQRQLALENLRQEHFGREENQAFFGDEQQLDEFTLARLDVESDASLSAAEKQRRVAQLEQQLPEPIRKARKRAVVHGDVYEKAETMKANNASEAEIYQLRAAELGEEAAMELAKLDKQQQQWKQRLSDYRQQRAQIEQASLSPADREAAIGDLRERMFSGPEQLRVRALDADM